MSRSQSSSAPESSTLLQSLPRAALLCALALLLLVACVAAKSQTAQTSPAALIERDRAMIADAGRLNLDRVQLGSLWARLGGEYEDQLQYQESEAAYTQAVNLLEHAPGADDRYVLALNNFSSLYMLTGRLDAAERLSKQALDAAERSGNPLSIARAEAHLGEVLLLMNRNKQAAERAQRAIYGLEGEDRASALLTYAYASCRNKHCREGEQAAREAVGMFHATTLSEPFALGEAYLALGFVQSRTGAVVEAGENMSKGLRILERELPPSSPLVQGALELYRLFLAANHRDREAARIAAREQTAMPCASCTINARGLR